MNGIAPRTIRVVSQEKASSRRFALPSYRWRNGYDQAIVTLAVLQLRSRVMPESRQTPCPARVWIRSATSQLDPRRADIALIEASFSRHIAPSRTTR